MLKEFSAVFATSETDIGTYVGPETMDVNTGNRPPIPQPPYRKSHTERRLIRNHIQQLLNQKIIQESKSDYSSPMLIVQKKTPGAVRLVIDYRKLNEVTKKELFPMPRLADIFDYLYGFQYFSSLDISNGYYHFFVHHITIEVNHSSSL